ncbi:MAG TPA: hypothetical protein VM537_24535 [Anaerolineae bacterium]|nr:hypothetical protein [Anaerolineae bacterium]
MSTHARTVIECDGCGRNDLDDHVQIIGSREVGSVMWPRTVHICADCKDQDRYICRLCNKVHGDDNPCREQIRAREQTR